MDRTFIISATREILRSIHTRKPLDDVLQEILTWACQLTNSIHGSFIRVDHTTSKLVISCVHGPDWTAETQQFVLPIGQGITGIVAKTGKPYLCSDTSNDPNYVTLFKQVRSELAVPVIIDEKVWGIMNLDGLESGKYDDKILREMELFAQLAAAAIEIRLKWDMEQRLQHELTQAEKLASLGKLLAGIAHEINNPLTAILGGASVLAYDCTDPELRRSLENIASEAQRAADLVKSLLAFSRRQTTEKTPHPINDLVQNTCSLVRHQLKLKSVRLEITLPDRSPYAMVNALQIQQVLLNLLNNAEHAIAEERKSDGHIHIEVYEDKDQAMIRISDNGIGMELHVAQSIYDPFFTTKEVGQGTGLGLSIAHNILTAHGGKITCSSGLHAGTVFTIRLPLVPPPGTKPEDPAGDAPAFRPRAKAHPLRILVVDDEEGIRYSLSHYLNALGIEAVPAANGQEALKAAHERDFDLVVSDIRMPLMDGMELHAALREINPRYANHFVFMTGDLVTLETRTKVDRLGCPCLEKPFPFQKLGALIQEMS